jgi:hypothetical protein
MKTTTRILILTALIAGIIVSACNVPGLQKDFDYGKVADGKYTNKYFGFSMPVPADEWYMHDKGYMDSMQERGINRIAGKNQMEKRLLDASKITTANLLNMTYKGDGENPSGCSIIVLATHNTLLSPVKNEDEYLGQMYSMLLKSQLKYERDGAIVQEKIGGRNFSILPVKIILDNGNALHQKYYCSMMDDFFFSIIATYFTDDQLAKIDGVLGKADFQKMSK